MKNELKSSQEGVHAQVSVIDAVDALVYLAFDGAEVNVVLGQHPLQMVHHLMLTKG